MNYAQPTDLIIAGCPKHAAAKVRIGQRGLMTDRSVGARDEEEEEKGGGGGGGLLNNGKSLLA